MTVHEINSTDSENPLPAGLGDNDPSLAVPWSRMALGSGEAEGTLGVVETGGFSSLLIQSAGGPDWVLWFC